VKTIDASEFEDAVKSNTNVIIQFSADWCGPCKRLTPIVENFVDARDDVTAYKVDIGEQTDLATKYQVRSIPKLIFFRDGTLSNEKVGLVNESKLSELITE
jgi:thioredoxin 1